MAESVVRWYPISRHFKLHLFAAGLVSFSTLIAYNKFSEAIDVVRNPADILHPGTLFLLRLPFGKARSRLMGSLCNFEIPVYLRSSLFRSFAWLYGANLTEARYPLETYRTFQEFFSRSLKPGIRPVESMDPTCLVAPCDGEILAIGEISEDCPRIQQVKGTTYNVKSFLGVDPLKHKAKDSVLKYCVIYLAPGDYHRFHAPTTFHTQQGRHFSGELLPVSKRLVSWFDDLFALNERVVLSGSWSMGQMHYGIVAAYNVGNIVLSFDDKLRTNEFRARPCYRGGEVRTKSVDNTFAHGDWIGSFKLGSTIVLIFETVGKSNWQVDCGDKIKMGQLLFSGN